LPEKKRKTLTPGLEEEEALPGRKSKNLYNTRGRDLRKGAATGEKEKERTRNTKRSGLWGKFINYLLD